MRQAQQESIHRALERSRSHNEIVTISVDDLEEALAEIAAHPDVGDYDYVDTRTSADEPLREVWDAEDQSGAGKMDWRVHLIQREGGEL